MEGHELLVRALGPLTVSIDGTEVPVPKAQVRTALAVLTMHLGQVVSRDVLADAIWGDHPPRGYLHGLHVITSQLRATLDPEPNACRERILSQPPGYGLTLDHAEFDVLIAERLIDEARRRIESHRLDEAETALVAAEMMWRGPPYAEFEYADFAQPEIRRLTELHLQVIEDRVCTQIDLGKHRQLIAELEGLVVEHPTRERLLRSLMVALDRSDRPAEALQCFDEACDRLRSDFGLEPSIASARLAESIRTAPWSQVTVQ